MSRPILELRPDLRKRFGFHLPENADAFLGWLVTTGTMEYAVFEDAPSLFADLQARSCGPEGRLTKLQHLVWLARPDVQKVFALPQQTQEYLGWFYTHRLEEHGYWRYLSLAERTVVLQLSEPWASRIRATAAKIAALPEPRVAFEDRAFGVNLIGYAFGELGIGEDARMAVPASRAIASTSSASAGVTAVCRIMRSHFLY